MQLKSPQVLFLVSPVSLPFPPLSCCNNCRHAVISLVMLRPALRNIACYATQVHIFQPARSSIKVSVETRSAKVHHRSREIYSSMTFPLPGYRCLFCFLNMRRSQTTNVGRVLFCLPRMLLTINGQLIALHRGSSGPALTKKPVHRQRDRCSYQSHHHTNSRRMECGHSFRLQMKHFGYTGISNSCPVPLLTPTHLVGAIFL